MRCHWLVKAYCISEDICVKLELLNIISLAGCLMSQRVYFYL